MAKVLVVIQPFGGRDRGQHITDAEEMEKILSGEHAHHVVQADHELPEDAA